MVPASVRTGGWLDEHARVVAHVHAEVDEAVDDAYAGDVASEQVEDLDGCPLGEPDELDLALEVDERVVPVDGDDAGLVDQEDSQNLAVSPF